MKRVLIALVLCGVLLTMAWPVVAQGDESPAAKAIAYLLTVQNADGGFGNGWTPDSDVGTTADIVVASALAGIDPEAFFVGDMQNPLSFLGSKVQDGTVEIAGAGVLAKVLMAATAVGKDIEMFGGVDLGADLLDMQNDDGSFGYGSFDHCLVLVALENAGFELPEGTVDALLAAQNEDGGWGFMASEASDTNTTGLCLQALAVVDTADAVESGFAYLAAIQNEDAGWPYQNPSDWGTDSDVNSTSLVAGALVAHGYDLAEWNNPQDWLASMQNESGAFGFQIATPDDNVAATVAAIPSVLGVSLNSWALEAAAE